MINTRGRAISRCFSRKDNLKSNAEGTPQFLVLWLETLESIIHVLGVEKLRQVIVGKQSVCFDTSCCEFGTPSWPDRLRRRNENKPHDLLGNEKKRRRRYSKVDRKITHNITWFHQSNRSCVRPWEKGEKLY